MAMPLLERDAFLHTLDDLLGQVEEGSGRIALVSGEAGIGKTSLVEALPPAAAAATRVLWGTCEALFTPRPLGPLYDFASQTEQPTATPFCSRRRPEPRSLPPCRRTCRRLGPPSVVIEDIHWADEATLDLIKFLARRIHRTRALLILTYRDDELGKDHPLRLVLGDLPARVVTRLHLPPLSEAAVAALVQPTGRSAERAVCGDRREPFFPHRDPGQRRTRGTGQCVGCGAGPGGAPLSGGPAPPGAGGGGAQPHRRVGSGGGAGAGEHGAHPRGGQCGAGGVPGVGSAAAGGGSGPVSARAGATGGGGCALARTAAGTACPGAAPAAGARRRTGITHIAGTTGPPCHPGRRRSSWCCASPRRRPGKPPPRARTGRRRHTIDSTLQLCRLVAGRAAGGVTRRFGK